MAITLTNTDKHTLPVESGCAYEHIPGIAKSNFTAPCKAHDDVPDPAGLAGLRRCVLDASCAITDDRLQMSVNRDPR